MKTDLDDWLNEPIPNSPSETKDDAWRAAALEFHRSQHQSKLKASRLWRRLGVAAGIAAGLTFATFRFWDQFYHDQLTRTDHALASPKKQPEMLNLFQEGVKLFGSKLSAVTIRENSVTWHFSEEETLPHQATTQLLVFSLRGSKSRDYQVATAPAFPITFELEEGPGTVDFISDLENNIIGSGNSIYLSSNSHEGDLSKTKVYDLGGMSL